MANGPRFGSEDPPGEREIAVGEVTFRLGQTVRLALDARSTAHDGMLDGRLATIERILIDYDDRVHLAVTIDDDPGQELMRETGRFLFFAPDEVEVAAT